MGDFSVSTGGQIRATCCVACACCCPSTFPTNSKNRRNHPRAYFTLPAPHSSPVSLYPNPRGAVILWQQRLPKLSQLGGTQVFSCPPATNPNPPHTRLFPRPHSPHRCPKCTLLLSPRAVIYRVQQVPYQGFFSEAVSSLPVESLLMDLNNWRVQTPEGRRNRFFFADHSFLISTETKKVHLFCHERVVVPS